MRAANGLLHISGWNRSRQAAVFLARGRTMTTKTKKAVSKGKATKRPPTNERHNQGTSAEFEQEGMGVAAKE